MKTVLGEHERLLRKGPANLQKGIETVGGRLYLTDLRLVFEAHALNVQGGVTEVALSEVVSTETVWTRFLGRLPIMPNSLAVHTMSGPEFRFVLYGRKGWKRSIDAVTADLRTGPS